MKLPGKKTRFDVLYEMSESESDALMASGCERIRSWGKIALSTAMVFAISLLILTGAYVGCDAAQAVSVFDSISLVFWFFWGAVSLILLSSFAFVASPWVDCGYCLEDIAFYKEELLWDEEEDENGGTNQS